MKDGDQMVDGYGGVWTRRDGRWYSVRGAYPLSDETVELLTTMQIKTAVIPEKTGGKISKSPTVTAPGQVYNYVLKRKE